jgi:diguanylate cyclase (GGDEF)-like protein
LYLNKFEYGERRALRLWTIGQLCKGLSVLAIMLTVVFDQQLVRISLTPLLFLGFSFEIIAYRLYAGYRQSYRWPLLAVLVASLLMYAGLLLPEHSRTSWAQATAAFNAAFFSLSAALILHHWLRHSQHTSKFLTVLVVTYYAHFTVCLVRVGFAICGDSNNLFSPLLTNQLNMLWNFTVMLFNGLGFVLLLKERADIQLKELTIRDPLTGIYNRRHFNEQLQLEFIRTQRYQEPMALAIIDLDNLKQINDQLGHQAGDEALRCLAEFVQRQIRSCDLWVRLGGDEFALLMPASTSAQAKQTLERLRHQFAESEQHLAGQRFNFSFSAGVSDSLTASGIDSLISQADRALYTVKHGGRNAIGVAPSVGVAS